MELKDVLHILGYTPNSNVITEAIDANKHLTVELLPDVNSFIKKNPSTKEITSPVFFIRPGQPNPEGLLSNEIFGLTKEERAGIWGYIDLGDYFIHPLAYKKMVRLNKKIRDIVHGTKTFSINENGELVEDENGNTGLPWFKRNFKRIVFKSTNSRKRDVNIQFINSNIDRLFMDKLLVLPAYYRDVNTNNERVAVGEVNELYASLIIAVRGIKETQDYGLDVSDSIRGRVQENILAIYDWFCGNNNDNLEGATGLSKKLGIIRRAGKSKTADYGSRLVLSAPDLKVESMDDIMVDIKHCAVPLASVCANFYPFMLYHVKRFFENEFAAGTMYDILEPDGTIKQYRVVEPMMQFSDERIKEELKRFIHGYSNRFIPVMAQLEDGRAVAMAFKGKYTDLNRKYTDEVPGESVLIRRQLTWCDVFYLAACEATKDKTVLITRYPIDSSYNQFPSLFNITTTKETEPIEFNGTFYRYYPKIRNEDIGTNTSNKFIDTLWLSNLMLKIIGGDYDGDTVSVKGVFTREANEELIEYINSKSNYIGLDGRCIRFSTNEAIQSIFNLTRVLSTTTLKEVQF